MQSHAHVKLTTDIIARQTHSHADIYWKMFVEQNYSVVPAQGFSSKHFPKYVDVTDFPWRQCLVLPLHVHTRSQIAFTPACLWRVSQSRSITIPNTHCTCCVGNGILPTYTHNPKLWPQSMVVHYENKSHPVLTLQLPTLIWRSEFSPL